MNNDKTYALTSGYPSTSFLFFSYIIKASLKETSDRNSFRMFSMHLFDGCSLNEELSNVLTAVLLLHMSDMQRLVPISVVLAK